MESEKMYGGATSGSGCLELLSTGLYPEVGTEGNGNMEKGKGGIAGCLEAGI